MGEEERFQEIKWLLNATIEEFDSFLKSAVGFEDVKVGNGWDPSKVPYFLYLLSAMPISEVTEIAEKKKIELFRSVFWVLGPRREKIEMIGEPKTKFMRMWEIEGCHECFFFRNGSYHLKVKDDVVAMEVEGKLRNLVVEASSSQNQTLGTGLDEKTSELLAQKPKYFAIDDVMELAYQSRRAHLFVDETGAEIREFGTLLDKRGKPESLSDRIALDDMLKGYLRDAIEKKKAVFEKLRSKIVKPPESFNKIVSNRFEVTRLNLFLVPFYHYQYRYGEKMKELNVNGLTGEVIEQLP
jgi:hypothetical protein